MRYINQKVPPARLTTGFIILLAAWLAACTPTATTPNSLAPQGPAAARIINLWWLAMGLGLLTYLLVLGCLLLALWRRRQPGSPQAKKWQRYGRSLILGGGIIFPVIMLIILYGFTLNTLSALSLPHASDRVLIEVGGHQWRWEDNYPYHRIRTANEIAIPVGEPVQFQLTSADVIHSFWVPELHGKLDLVPGRINNWWLQADTPGEYWGLCAEFCGPQHANKMLFVVVAEPEAAFETWLTTQAQPADEREPTDGVHQRGQTVFMETGCSNCHTIQGTAATGELGPDLTHFASRLVCLCTIQRAGLCAGNCAGLLAAGLGSGRSSGHCRR